MGDNTINSKNIDTMLQFVNGQIHNPRKYGLKMLSLPLEFWSLDILKAIGNNIGSFIKVDGSYLNMNSWAIDCTLVEVDLKEDLVEDIVIEVGNMTFLSVAQGVISTNHIYQVIVSSNLLNKCGGINSQGIPNL
jgi:hypothetical protein